MAEMISIARPYAEAAFKFARDAQALVDVEGIIESGIIDQAFPADRGAGFFEIDPHHDEHVIFEAIRLSLEFGGVFERGFRIMNRAGTDDGHEAIVLA